MPLYIRFDNGKQVEVNTLPSLPTEGEWIEAPAEFDFIKRYKLVAGVVQEVTTEEIAAEVLAGAKTIALELIKSILDKHRLTFAGYSHTKGKSYLVQEKAASLILEAIVASATPDAEAVSVIEPLAVIRSITLEQMATIIHQKALIATKAVAKLEAMEDTIERAISECDTKEEIMSTIASWEQQIVTDINTIVNS